MALTCPHCKAELTTKEVIRLHRQYASGQRKTKSGGSRGGRRPRCSDSAFESEAELIIQRANEARLTQGKEA